MMHLINSIQYKRSFVNINPQSNTDFTQVTCTVHFYYRSNICISIIVKFYNIEFLNALQLKKRFIIEQESLHKLEKTLLLLNYMIWTLETMGWFFINCILKAFILGNHQRYWFCLPLQATWISCFIEQSCNHFTFKVQTFLVNNSIGTWKK